MGRWPVRRWWVADAGSACMLEPVLELVSVVVARTVVAGTAVVRTVDRGIRRACAGNCTVTVQ